jgi:hypothetical protein
MIQWSAKAYAMFLDYIRGKKAHFMCEDFRDAVSDLLPAPPSARAFGGIFMKAARLGLIEHVRYAPVKNVRAHRANASVWRAR